MINKDVHIYEQDQYVCLYNAITMNVVYLQKKGLCDGGIPEELQSQIPKEFWGNHDYYEEALCLIDPFLKIDLRTMFMIINENCNLYCEYCRYIHKLPDDYVGCVMDPSIGEKLIHRFLTWNVKDSKDKTIVFFGTEVLQHPKLVEELAKNTRMIESKENLKPTELIIFTNGTLITEWIANFIIQYNITPIVSIDGWAEIHDKMRINKNGKGTYEKIRQNCNLLKNKGVRIGISSAVGEHNIDFLPEIIEFFSKEFEPLNIGLNPLEISNKYSREVFFEKYIEQGLRAFEIARKKGISIPQVMRRIRPFVEKRHRLKECPTCGGAIRVYPNGRTGTCSHFVAVNEHCIDHDAFINEDFEGKDVFKQWSYRTQFKFKQCRNCPAISLCGGGCVYNASLQNKNIMAPDYRICTHSKYALEWCIWELFKLAQGEVILEKQSVFYPEQQLRTLIYGNIDEKSSYLPLQQYNTFGEFSIYNE
jgi:uncharacterized protein